MVFKYKFFYALAGILLMITFASFQTKTNQPMNNPLFPRFNEAIDFKNLKPEHVSGATERIIALTKDELAKIYVLKDGERTFDNTMRVYDDLTDKLGTVLSNIYLMSNVHPDSVLRAEAQKSIESLSKYSNEIGLDEKLYMAIKAYSLLPECKQLSLEKQRFVTKTVIGFERNGFALPKEKRDELKKIQDKLAEIDLQFSTNINDYVDSLIVDEAGIDGLPDDYKTTHKTADGKYSIDLSYPSYIPFMKYSKSEKTRKELYLKYQNRAAAKNLAVLDEILIYRDKMAKLLGFPTYAAYQLEDKMAKTPKQVWDFESDLTSKVRAKALKDYDELLTIKRNYLGDPSQDHINPWESSFYNNLLLVQKYQLENEKVKEYFEVDNVISGLFKITQSLYDLKFEEIKNASTWHQDVKCYEIRRDGQLAGIMYLDLHPRPNKYNHAACFQMINSKKTVNGLQIPVASLVCNFPRATAEKPALIAHSDVETFFHEFGHLMHHILSNTELSAQTGFGVANDFVEVPSQFFEHWAWDYNSLKLFAKHYKTGEVLPIELYHKMLSAKNVGSGIQTQQQIFYGTLDMTLHDRFIPGGPETTTDVVKRLQNSITLYPYLDGTHFQAGFGHLNGYGAGYYGYLWARVYAEDLFTPFAEKGIMDKATGVRFRDIVLARGATVDELQSVTDFLNRKPNSDAFLRYLGL
jgi:thimet oligopeptidase